MISNFHKLLGLRLLLSCLFLLVVNLSMATHNRAGEIIFTPLPNLGSLTYQIDVITYTKASSQAADRCELEFEFSDGTNKIVQRINGGLGSNCPHEGELLGNDIKKNIYRTQHTFPGAGTFTISVEDPNRNSGIQNIPKSVEVPFFIQSTITIDFQSGANTAAVLQNPPIDQGCVGQIFEHNPGAVDPDGDSLVYKLVKCLGENGAPIPNYVFPDEINPGPNNNLTLDERTGTLTWDSPPDQGEFNVCIQIEEYRRNVNSGNVIKVGTILRDMQITIGTCDDEPPMILAEDLLCVKAGDSIRELITATDADGDILELSAVGYPFELQDNPAEFATVSGQEPISSIFRWSTECKDVRVEPYFIYFKAYESINSFGLVDFEVLQIEVNGPPVEITSIVPKASRLEVQWSESECDEVTGYDLYRYNDSLGYFPPECVTGVPATLGYELIGSTVSRSSTFFVDDGAGIGLVHGQRYCYMVVAKFPDGSESYPSPEACGELIRDVPIINKVSVVKTDLALGADSIAWFKPIDLDLVQYPGPYKYILERSEAGTLEFEVIYESEESANAFDLDTHFLDENINSSELQYLYKVGILSNGELVGYGNAASSVFLSALPSDNKIALKWDVTVPWQNNKSVVYRFSNDPDSVDVFNVLDTVVTNTYLDKGLANGKTYRYFVRTIGRYTSSSLPQQLENLSQIIDAVPIDNEPPCPPQEPFIVADCDLESSQLTWLNPNDECPETEDVLSYNIYFAPVLGDELQLIDQIFDPEITEYVRQTDGSIAGCYVVTAVDSFDNESPLTNPLCVDNCPYYELPNVFTPGADGVNDLFVPFPYKFVESIDITIYNRWGAEVFSTTDPDVLWNGTNQANGEPSPSGVYYYTCTVNEIKLSGIDSRVLNGYVQLIREEDSKTSAP